MTMRENDDISGDSGSAVHPPYVWFGGKRAVAPVVWKALGDVAHYVEPFFGGGSVLLVRPHRPRLETINDYDGFVANFWRAVQAEPDAVADAMNRPVNEVDLQAIHRTLCRMPDKAEFLDRMLRDPAHYDVLRAAWWCWGLNAWIGSGWCEGQYVPDDARATYGTGLGDGRKRPNVGRGRGIHRQRPGVGESMNGECERRGEWLRAWMRALCDRLRNVVVCCGDWQRVCTDGATAQGTTVGIFLDPPYSGAVGRDTDIYRCEDLTVSERVYEYCVKRTGDDRYRIVLAGYEGEHDGLEALGWRACKWETQGGFANTAKDEASRGKMNRSRERLWFSPSCLADDDRDRLFSE